MPDGSDSPVVFHLGPQPIAKVVRETRAAYDAGRDVMWISTRDGYLRKAANALNGWRAAHGCVRRVGAGRTLIVFAHSEHVAPYTYWPRKQNAS